MQRQIEVLHDCHNEKPFICESNVECSSSASSSSTRCSTGAGSGAGGVGDGISASSNGTTGGLSDQQPNTLLNFAISELVRFDHLKFLFFFSFLLILNVL